MDGDVLGDGWKDIHRKGTKRGRVYFNDDDIHIVGDVFKPALERCRR
jgi:hypothetical protein